METNKKLNLEVRNIFLQGHILSIAGDALRCTVLLLYYSVCSFNLTLVGSFRSSSKMLMNIIWREKCKCSYHRQWHKEHREWHHHPMPELASFGGSGLWGSSGRRDKTQIMSCTLNDTPPNARIGKFWGFRFVWGSSGRRDKTQIVSCTLLL
jgi:hypothetical protein